MDATEKKALMLGIGNYLMGDEGVGVYIAQKMTQESLPPGVEVLDGGTGGFHLMGHMEQYPLVVMVDATLDGRAAGSVRQIRPRFSSDLPRAMSTHDVGLRDVVEAMSIRGTLPEIVLFVISVEEVQPMYIGLSPAVKAAADALIPDLQYLLSKSVEKDIFVQ